MSPLDVLLDKEAGEMLAEDLIDGVALDALAAGVPGDDVAVGVQHIDGIIVHAFDDGPYLLVLAAKLILHGPLLGRIADKAEYDRAGRRLHRLEHDVHRKLGAIPAQAEQVQGRAHLSRARVGVVVFAVTGVVAPEALRDQGLDAHPDQFGLLIAEQFRRTRVRATDKPGGVRDKNRVWGKREQIVQH